MDLSRIILKNTSFQFTGKIFTVFAAILLNWVLRLKLQNDGYGVYVFVSAFVLFFGNISDWGTNFIAVREASKSSNQKLVFSSTLLLRFVLSLIGFVIANIAIRVNIEWKEFVVPTTIASFVLLFLSLKTSINIVFQTAIRLSVSTFIEVILSLFFLFLGFLALVYGFGVNGVLAAWVISTFLSVLVGIFFVKGKLSTTHIDSQIIKKIIKGSLPTGVLLIIFSLYNRIDIIILQHFWGVHSVGIYGLSYKIYETLIVGAAFIMNSTYPLLSREKNKETLKIIFQKNFDILLGVSVLLILVTFFLAPTITYVFDNSANESIVPLRILSFAILFSYLNHLMGYSLIAQGKQTVALMIGFFVLIFNIVFNWILIPYYSYNSAAWMTVFTEGIVFLLSSIAFFKIFGFYPSLFSFPKTLYSLTVRMIFKKC